jgi:gliding motility-associated-like protein
VVVFAGNDTSVVRGQPLQLNATSNFTINTTYFWSPGTGLNDVNIYNPVSTLNTNADSIKYKVTVTLPEGCKGEDYIVVKVFKTAPEIFVPSGFTPNGDGRNDVLKPITVGISKLDYFRVFNRWGQLIYETNQINKGWDGTINGTPQSSDTFVFMVQGSDYTGKVVFRKGTTVLIR